MSNFFRQGSPDIEVARAQLRFYENLPASFRQMSKPVRRFSPTSRNFPRIPKKSQKTRFFRKPEKPEKTRFLASWAVFVGSSLEPALEHEKRDFRRGPTSVFSVF
jgi:hypothetical protein